MNVLTIQHEALNRIRRIALTNPHSLPLSEIICEINRANLLIRELPQPAALNGRQSGALAEEALRLSKTDGLAESAQKVVITLTDKPNSTVGCELDFDPPMKVQSETSAAVLLAMEMVDFVASKHQASKAEVQS